MKCHRAGCWRMEVLNVKESHFQSRILCLCSRTPTQEESKSISRHATFQKTQSLRSLREPDSGERLWAGAEDPVTCWGGRGVGRACVWGTCVSRRTSGAPGKTARKETDLTGESLGLQGLGPLLVCVLSRVRL